MHLDTFFSVSEHTSLFLFSVVLGAALGVVYDCFRVFRILFPHDKRSKTVAAEDIIFWLIYGFCVFCYAAAFARGQVRFFIVLGSLTGFVLYIVTVGNLITGVIRRIVTALYKLLHKVYSAIIEPIVKCVKIICQKMLRIFVRIHKNFENPKEVQKNS